MHKKICHVTSVHGSGDSRIFHKECVSLSKDYEVFFIAPNTGDRTEKGVHILGVPLPQNRVRRLLNLNKVYKKAKLIDAEVYHFHDPELMSIGLRLKKIGKKVIFDSHEDVPMQILTKEYLPKWSKAIISSLYSKYEAYYLSKYDALVSVTPTIVERLKTINENTYMVTNYPVVSSNENDTEIPFSERKSICFAGGVDFRYMHENIIKSLEYTDANYLLAGPAMPDYLNGLKQLKMWPRVDYCGIIKHDKVHDLYKRSFAGVALLYYSPNVGYHKGTLGVLKMFEYMMDGIPVIVTDFDIWKGIVEKYCCGICVNPNDIHAIADAINYYYNNPEVAKRHGENGRKAVVEEYNWNTQETVLLDIYRTILCRE